MKINIVNKKAGFEFNILDKYIAGLILTGTEIKSIREGRVSIKEAYCQFQNSALWIKKMHISVYEKGTYNNHEPTRNRKLLLNKKELKKLNGKVSEKGFTIIPVRLFISERGFAKLEIGLAKGKKVYDKRQSIKEKDMKREMRRREKL